jgi:hypothetical protein
MIMLPSFSYLIAAGVLVINGAWMPGGETTNGYIQVLATFILNINMMLRHLH